MKNKSVLYVFLMALFGMLAYLFIMLGIDTKTKVYVTYQEKSDVFYKVHLNDKYLDMNNSYLTEMTDYIDINFKYDILYDKSMNGYYSYNVVGYLTTYTDSIDETLWKKEYKILEDKVKVIDQNDVKLLKINDTVRIDFVKYREEILDFIEQYDIELSGYLLLHINVNTMLDFRGMNESVSDNKVIKVNIPLTKDLYKINVLNKYDDIDSYAEFSKKEDVNYLFLIVGLFCLAVFITLVVMVIREFVKIENRESLYKKRLRKILDEYDHAIVNVNKFYNKKKYNLIYVDSFSELIDVYNNVNMPINFREIKKNSESLFVIIHEDSAWIYKMMARKIKKSEKY